MNVEFLFSPHVSWARLARHLAPVGRPRSVRHESIRVAYHDTFDWRLHAAGLFLEQQGPVVVLGELKTGRVMARQKLTARPWPRQPGAWPAGPVQRRLVAAAGGRALLPVARCACRLLRCRLDSAAPGMSVRATYGRVVLPSAPGFAFLRVEDASRPGGGARQAVALLGEVGWAPEDRPRHVLLHALQRAGRVPGDYSPLVEEQLDPAMPAPAAVRQVLGRLFDVVRRNEPGVRAHWDPEFLHEYRIAVRKSRSLVAQLRDVFPARPAEAFRRQLAELGDLTNRARDLDVYLLREAEYRRLVPPALRPGLDAFFTHLRRAWRAEQRRLAAAMAGQPYHAVLAAWQDFLAGRNGAGGTAPAATEPIFSVAGRHILKAYARVVRTGRALDETASDHELHGLRIQCKKLRYLLELFVSLYPRRRAGRLVDDLRRLQACLGMYNDLRVQQEFLVAYLSGNVHRKRFMQTAAAIGALIARIHAQQQGLRRQFGAAFAALARPAVAGRFQRLCRSP